MIKAIVLISREAETPIRSGVTSCNDEGSRRATAKADSSVIGIGRFESCTHYPPCTYQVHCIK